MVVNSVDVAIVVAFAAVVVTAIVSWKTHLPITALEIVAGIALVALLGFTLPSAFAPLLTLGSLLIVFLAGLETNLDFLTRNLRRAFTLGLGGFLAPFAGLFLLLRFGLGAPLLVSILGATALADTSISIVYTTLRQYDLTDLPFGRLVLAGTLAVNLTEDFTVTMTTFLTTPGFVFTLAVLGALAAAALLLPRLSRAIGAWSSKSYANVEARTLFLGLAVLATLSALVGVPGILFVFLMGLMFSRFVDREFLKNIQGIAFAFFIPLYFLAVGLRVDVGFVASNLLALAAIVAVASALKIAAIYPAARRFGGPAKALPTAALMNTRLTSATVILTLTLSLGLISDAWYSLFISAVVLLALGSVTVLRGFPSFASPTAAKGLFGAPDPMSVEDGRPGGGPASVYPRA